MKKLFYLCAVLSSMLIALPSSAQLEIGGQLTTLKNTKEDFSITGLGLHSRIFIGNNLAIGGNLRLWPKKYQEVTQGSSTIRYGNFVGDLAGMLEYYFGEEGLRPYFGADAGAYFTNNILTIENGGSTLFSQSEKKNYFGIGPKAGLSFDLTGFLGLYAQVQYNFLFGSASEIQSNGFNSKPIDKFWSLDLGAYFRLKASGKRK